MAKQRSVIGALVEIDLGDCNYAYARIVSKSEPAFYDRLAEGKVVDYAATYEDRIAFITSVTNSAVTSGRWTIVDKRPLEPELAQERKYFMLDAQSGEYSLYYSISGDIRPASAKQCTDLERAAVWDPEHVEDRLRDHFAGRTNGWVVQMTK